MDRSSIYMLVEQAISETDIKTDEDIKRVNLIYAAAVLFLDGGITAWYKSALDIAIIDIDQSVEEDKNMSVEERRLKRIVRELGKVPWLIPMYSFSRGLSVELTDAISPIINPDNFILKALVIPDGVDVNSTILDSYRIIGGRPPGTRLMGMAFFPSGLQIDEWPYDFSKGIDTNDAYISACTAILEMGGKNLKNIPFGGVMHFSNTYLCPYGMNRLSSPWDVLIRDGATSPGILSRWLNYKTYFETRGYISSKLLATWDNVNEAGRILESVYYNIRNLFSSSHSFGKILIESDPLPKEPSIATVKIRSSEEERFTANRLEGRMKVIESKHIKLADGFKMGLILNFYLPLSNLPKGRLTTDLLLDSIASTLQPKSKIWMSVSEKMNSIKLTRAFDSERVRRIIRRISTLRSAQSLEDRQRLLKLILKDLIFKPSNHQFVDAESGIIVACEHIIEELTLLAKDPSADIKGIITTKYVAGKTMMPSESKEREDLPIVIVCKYCGMDLGSDWLITTYERTDEIKQIQLDYTSDEFGSIVVDLVGQGVVTTTLQPVALILSVHRLIGSGIKEEKKKLGRSSDRIAKSEFMSLAGVVAALVTLNKAGAPITVNQDVLEAFVGKQYFDVIRTFGFTPKNAIARMMGYWDSVLASQFSNPLGVISSIVNELMGISKDVVLITRIRKLVLSPLRIGKKMISPAEIESSSLPTSSKEYYRNMTDPNPNIRILGTKRPPANVSRYHPSPSSSSILDHLPDHPTIFHYFFSRVVETGGSGAVGSGEMLDAIRIFCPVPVSGMNAEKNLGAELEKYIQSLPIVIQYHDYGTSTVCVRCGYDRAHSPTEQYLAKYGTVITRDWVVNGPASRDFGKRTIDLPVTEETLPDSVNEKVMSDFIAKYQWYPPSSPSKYVLEEMVHIISRFGHYSVAKQLETNPKAIGSGWNLIMKWCLEHRPNEAMELILRMTIASMRR